MPHKNKGGLLAKVNFPLFTVQMLTSRHILVGGGGGKSKTGVANGFEVFELSHDGSQFVAEEMTRYETGPNVVMNSASYTDGKKSWLVAGQESHCQLYNIHTKVVSENGEILTKSNGPNSDGMRQRKKSERSDENVTRTENTDKDGIKHKKLQFVVKPADSVQTDFGDDEPIQRIVRISTNGKFMATGGTDGVVRLWKFPQMSKVHNLELHSKEIDDIDFSPDGKFLVTIAKDNRMVMWDVISGSKVKELSWNPSNGAKYMYKRCRFRKTSEKDAKTQLLSLCNSLVSKNPNYLQLWDTEIGSINKVASCSETLSALAVSDDGRFVAVGTMTSGNVDMYIAFSLQKVLHVPGAHRMFVTGLEFLPTKLDGPAITSNTEAAVVSISVDNKICIHSIPFRHAVPFWVVIVLIVIFICGAFILCSYLGI